MKINFFVPAIGDSGGIKVIYKYADMLSNEGHDVVLYNSIIAPNMHRYNSRIKNMLHRVWCTLKSVISSLNPHEYDKYIFSIRNESVRNADVQIATSWTTVFGVNKLDINKGRKLHFVQGFEVWDNREKGLQAYKLPIDKIVISTWINVKLKQELGIGPFPIVYNGIDDSVYNSSLRLDNTENIISFLMMNHPLPIKGVEQGIKAFERVKNNNANVRLKMFGMCSNDHLPEYVEYVQNPSKEELVKLYSESDIFLFPSTEEGWGLAPIEAMACGCAVVGTKTGFVLDVGINEENMMISEPGDVDEMVNNIEKILKNDELLEKIRYGGMKVALGLSWESSVKQLLKLLGEGYV